MIKREVIDEIILRNDIESLIGGYISLKRAGTNLKGLCPFHSEKTPSFTVYPADNSFYCFGCGIGGNAITFIRQIEHLDYPDAVEFLAKRAGITVLRDDNPAYEKKTIDKPRLLQMNVDAAKFFHRALFENSQKAREALSYFTEKRGLSIATIKHFGLGFAPDSFDLLMNYMLQKGYTRDELVVAYLAGKNDKGHYYDAFRNRVMFPIIDVSGSVIAFGGRVMDDSKPKYKNTMDTPVFKKSRNLFALNFAKNTSSESLILCEGYMDVIALHAAGFTNAVATLGTAITPEQARLMSRYTKKVIISYDADEAGQKAAQKAMKLLGEVGLDVGVIKVPGAKDPDEYIKTYGKEKFAEVISASKTKFEYNMDSILSRYDINLPQDRINALEELEKIISQVYFKAERDIYIQTVAERLKVEVKSVRDDVERISRKQIAIYKKNEKQKAKQNSIGYSDRTNPDFVKAPAIAKNEEAVLGLLLLYPEHRKNVFENSLLSSDNFYSSLNKRIFEYLHQSYADDSIDINEIFTPDELGRITKMKIARMSLAENGPSVLAEYIELLAESMQKKAAGSVSTIDDLNKLITSKRK
ncbi:MAG: DNA primase [Ruminococcaceae bacterium]|nr:DNA primase [Oscillospiraceae bacterium]